LSFIYHLRLRSSYFLALLELETISNFAEVLLKLALALTPEVEALE